MSTADAISAEKLYPNELFHINSNEQTPRMYNRKRSVQHPYEHETLNHTPKRNRVETSDCEIEIDQQQLSKLSQNKQKPEKSSTATSNTSSYFNMSHQFKKSVNDSSIQTRRESSRQTFPPFRITLKDVNRYPTTELGVIKEINKQCKLNLTYVRFTKTSDNQMCLLLYASTTTQFDYLMCESNWPSTINNTKYKLDLPNKIPSSYSRVVPWYL
jgi:hypothetical protein